MRAGSIACQAGSFSLVPIAGCIAAQLCVRVANAVQNISGANLGVNASGQAGHAAYLILSRSGSGDDPQPQVIFGDEVVPLNPKVDRYFACVIDPAGGNNSLGGAAAGPTKPPTLFLDYRAFETAEEMLRFRQGFPRDAYGSARVADYKRWRLVVDTGVVDMTAGFGPIVLDVGDCREYQLIQEAGNGTVAGSATLKPVGVSGVVGATPLNTANYGLPASNGQQPLTGNTNLAGPTTPLVQLAGTGVTNGTLVRLSFLVR